MDREGSTNHLGDIAQVKAGNSFTCALNTDGEVLCWGSGEYGQLGNDDGYAHKDHPVSVVEGNGSENHLDDIVEIGGGSSHTCALKSSGGVLCWGSGQYGKLGNDAEGNNNNPVNVVGEDDDDPADGDGDGTLNLGTL